MDKNGQSVACKNWNVYSPQRQNNLIVFWLPYSGLGKAVAGICPGCAMQLDALAFLPHPTDITNITDIAPPPPPTIRLCSLCKTGANVSGPPPLEDKRPPWESTKLSLAYVIQDAAHWGNPQSCLLHM